MLSSVSNKGSGIKVTWKKVTGAASYYVYRRTNNGAWKRRAVLSASSNSYIDRNVKQGKKYTYKVRAYNNGIFGRFSSEKKGISIKDAYEYPGKKYFWKTGSRVVEEKDIRNNLSGKICSQSVF